MRVVAFFAAIVSNIVAIIRAFDGFATDVITTIANHCFVADVWC